MNGPKSKGNGNANGKDKDVGVRDGSGGYYNRGSTTGSDIAVNVEDLEKDFLSTAFVKSSQALKIDEEHDDPPHLRLVLILQIDSIKLSLPLDMYVCTSMYVCTCTYICRVYQCSQPLMYDV